MNHSDSGLAHGTSGSPQLSIKNQEMANKAKENEKNIWNNALKNQAYTKIQHLIGSTSGSRGKAMAVGAYDEKTGKTVAAFAGEIPKKIHPDLLKLAERVGGVGSLGVTDRNTVGVCAEFHVINDMLLSDSKLEHIRLTRPIRPRTGQFMPYCDNCRAMFLEIIERSS
ncbi:MAG: hypothetical protein K6F84_02085 [Lachnospiraceae bacterium]|nr:hypothetical protein [Lachnospiraceae bacterium]